MSSLTLNPIDVLAIREHTASLISRVHRAKLLKWTPEQQDALARLRREHAERLNAPASPVDVALMTTVLETFAPEYRRALHDYYCAGASAEEASDRNGLTVEVFAAARILARKHFQALARPERVAR
jgi:hypothetical protein